MITKISIKNFKKLSDISFSTAQSVVLIGPNNAGKTTIFQALCLWETGVTAFLAAKQKRDLSKGYVVINRQDLMNSPILDARFLWTDKKVTQKNNGNGQTPILLEVALEGEKNGRKWECTAQFTFANAESLTCRLISGEKEMRELYKNERGVRFGFLQAMSGISISEDKLTQGSVDRKLGEGRTAEVLRNICFDILYPETPKTADYKPEENWAKLVKNIKQLFGATIEKPDYIRLTGLIDLFYTENQIKYDVSSAGRGFQQTLLLLAYLYAHPNTTLLLDEPDAHLEVIRQREIFQMLNKIAEEVGSQIIIASHSEVILEEAAEHAQVVAIIENQAVAINESKEIGALKKSLTQIGWDKYYLAKLKKHILYLEGPTDLEMLLRFAKQINHPVERLLSEANVHYLGNNLPNDAKINFMAIHPLMPELKGLALFDRLDKNVDNRPIVILCWSKREIENYFARPFILSRFAQHLAIEQHKDIDFFDKTMRAVIADFTTPIRLRNLDDTWWNDAKLTDDWLDSIFPEFYKRINVSPILRKGAYYQLINWLKPAEIDPEITEKLDVLYSFLHPKGEKVPIKTKR